MFASYPSVLDQLVARVEHLRQKGTPLPLALEVVHATRDFFKDWPTEEEYQALLADIAGQFREVVARVEAEWGPPEFLEDRRSRRLVPPPAIEAATWLRGDNRDVVASVYYEHQDKELPIVLMLQACDRQALEKACGGGGAGPE